MKNLFLITLSILLLASCGKTPQNGNLDGQWIMQEMYSKKDVNSTEYIKADRANPTIWNVSLSMILISTPGTNHNDQTGTTTCKMIYKGDKLSITHTFIHHRTEDLLITDPNTTCLESVGIRGNACDYRVVKLNSSHLTLCSSRDSLIFRKKH